jgi:hypothetical protein
MKLFSSHILKFNVLMILGAVNLAPLSFPSIASAQEACVMTSAGDVVCGKPVPKPISPQTTQLPSASCQYKSIEPFRVEIKPEKKIYNQVEEIAVKFSIVGTPDNYRQWITVVKASKPENEWGAWSWVGRSGSVSLAAQPPGEYQIRMFIRPSSEDILVGYCSITVKSVATR